jgi:hypothetical protein
LVITLSIALAGAWFYWGRSGASFQRAADHLQNAIRARDHAECMQAELEYAQAVVRLVDNLKACASAGKFSDQEYLVIMGEVLNRKYLGGGRDESTFLFANSQLLAALEITKLNGYGDDLPAFVQYWQAKLQPDADAFVEQSYKKHPEIASQVLRTMAAMSRKR